MRKDLLRAAGIVSLMTLASRILGMLRDIVSANQFGTSWQWDAFVYAFMFPNFFRRIVGEGALSSAFIPVYSETLRGQGKTEALRLANIVATVLSLILAIVILSVEGLSTWILTWQDIPQRLVLTLELLRILFPYLAFMSLVALGMGILNCHQHFLTPAVGPVILNMLWIGCILWMSPNTNAGEPSQLRLLAWIILVAGAIQLAIQLPHLRRLGFEFRWIWNTTDEGLRKIGALLLPAILSFAVVQINILVDMTLAFVIGPGASSTLWYGTRLMQFPLGVFAIAMGTALLPALSKQVAEKQYEESKKTLSFALRSVFFIILPCAVGLIVLREPIIRILFERGEFDALSTSRTAAVLLAYSIGLFAYAGQKIVTTGFYAVQDTKTPVSIGIAALITNVILNLILMRPLAEAGLALATSLAGILHFGLLVIFYDRKIGAFPFKEVIHEFIKILLAAIMMGVVCYGLLGILSSIWLMVLIPIIVSVVIYILSCMLFRVQEIKDVIVWMQRKRTV